jgi:hypothetical protein
MALSRNFGVNHADGVTGLESLVRHTKPSASAQFLDFIELAENCTFLDRKLTSALKKPWMDTSSKIESEPQIDI